jgi:hypothetical protein
MHMCVCVCMYIYIYIYIYIYPPMAFPMSFSCIVRFVRHITASETLHLPKPQILIRFRGCYITEMTEDLSSRLRLRLRLTYFNVRLRLRLRLHMDRRTLHRSFFRVLDRHVSVYTCVLVFGTMCICMLKDVCVPDIHAYA